MFKSRTVFVLGAGASADINIPTGPKLQKIIRDKLNFYFDAWTQKSGDELLWNVIKHYAQNQNANPNIYFEVAHIIRDGLFQATSIDDFIDTHSHRNEIGQIAKLAIAQTIAESEKASKIYSPPGKVLKTDQVGQTWFHDLSRLMFAGIKADNPSELIKKVSFISFNYDRAIYHYLTSAISEKFHLSLDESFSIVQQLKIFHPYGSLGPLSIYPVQDTYSYGQEKIGYNIINMAANIKTYSEQITDELTSNYIHDAIASAQQIIFLGFAFHPPNIKILAPKKTCQANNVYATALNMSSSDVSVIKHDIALMLNQPSIPTVIDPIFDCSSLITSYSRALQR